MLAGCSGVSWFAERDAWRSEAEVECLNSGTVKEGAGIVRVDPIRGPGICGADYPFKVSSLGDSSPLGYTDDPRPPGAIPGNPAAAPPHWPIRPSVAPGMPNAVPSSTPPHHQGRKATSYDRGGAHDQPISLTPTGVAEHQGTKPQTSDFRRPYGIAAPPPAGSPRADFSPVPYERRPLIDARDVPTGVVRAPLREPVAVENRAVVREALAERVPQRQETLVPLGPSRETTGPIAPVAINPPATLACPMVSELDRWIANSVQPAAMRWFGTPVAEIKQISAYSCRGMNGNPRSRISEHAFGNALDIASFTLADGRTITVKGGWHGLPEEQGFLRDLQGAACDQFATVLAPGSNVYHYDHIHIDLMRRRSGNRACNPDAESGEQIAARAAAKYAGRREPSVTGSLLARRLTQPARGSHKVEQYRDRALPLAQPGEDGEDD